MYPYTTVLLKKTVYEVEFVEHLHQEHKIRKRETGTTPPTETVTDNHDYYTSKVVSDPDGVYWTELEGHTRHHFRCVVIMVVCHRFSRWRRACFSLPNLMLLM